MGEPIRAFLGDALVAVAAAQSRAAVLYTEELQRLGDAFLVCA